MDVPARYVDAGHLGLAYAMTVNKAHGTTCDATMLLADDLLYRELAYEAMFRGRTANRIYMSLATATELDLQLEDGPHARTIQPQQDAIEILAAGLERRHAKHLALELSTSPSASRVKSGASPAVPRMAPDFLQPPPSILYQSPPVNIVVAVMAFIVRVPVLSLLMTVVPPSVSTS